MEVSRASGRRHQRCGARRHCESVVGALAGKPVPAELPLHKGLKLAGGLPLHKGLQTR